MLIESALLDSSGMPPGWFSAHGAYRAGKTIGILMLRKEITLEPCEGFNLRLLANDSPQHPDTGDRLDVTPARTLHHWFAARLANLPLDRELTLRICMAGQDVLRNKASVEKWRELYPLLTYADPLCYESYEWFHKRADGCWVSGDLCKGEEERLAGSGRCPEQQVLPATLAEQCLSKDERYWSPWRELRDTHAAVEDNYFEIHHRFEADTAAIAMHLPYTYHYLQQFLARLQARQFPGVFLDEIGVTPAGRKLQVIRVEDPRQPMPARDGAWFRQSSGVLAPSTAQPSAHRTILITAREHGAEHSTSRVVQGVLRALLNPTAEAARLRENATWLLVPIFDPDGSANSEFNTLSSHFYTHHAEEIPQAILDYATYLRAFINSGYPLHAVASFFNLECNEGETVAPPFIRRTDAEVLVTFNRFWFARLARQGFLIAEPDGWSTGLAPFRLAGWAADVYGALPLIFEVNDRYPRCRLTMEGLEEIGHSFAVALMDFYQEPIARVRLQAMHTLLARRAMQMCKRQKNAPHEEITADEMINLGF